jgi:hypothetical protein
MNGLSKELVESLTEGVRSPLPNRSEILMQRWYGPIRTSGRS